MYSVILKRMEEMFKHEQEETRIRAQRAATAVDRGEVENPADFQEVLTDDHKYSGLLDED